MQPYSLVSKSKYQVFENFLDDPDEVLQFSKSSNYYTAKQYAEYNKSESIGKWPGLRTKNLMFELPEVVNKIQNMFDVKVGWITFYKHLLEQNISAPMPHIDKAWDFSGVIYLEGNGGTWIDGDEVPFKYNRAVCFNANVPHHPLHGNTDRTVITFFSKYTT